MMRLISGLLSFFCVFLVFSCFKQDDTGFYAALKEKNHEQVKNYFERGYKINAHLEDPLEIAVKNNDPAMISLLVENGANPNSMYNDDSLLRWAIKSKDIGLIELLINKGADVNFINSEGYSVFSAAAHFLPDENLEIFLRNGLVLTGKAKINNEAVSYFRYLLYEKKSKTALLFLKDKNVVNETINDPTIIFTLLKSWNSDVKTITDILVDCGLKVDDELPLLQHTTGNYDAALWLLDHGVSPLKEYNNPDDADFLKTPLDSAYYALYALTEGEGRGGEDAEEIIERKKVIELLKEHINTR